MYAFNRVGKCIFVSVTNFLVLLSFRYCELVQASARLYGDLCRDIRWPICRLYAGL